MSNKNKHPEPTPKKEKEQECTNENCSCECEHTEPQESDELIELRAKVFLLETEIEKLKKEQNEKILEFITKKSQEAEKIIANKESEILEKYKKEYEEKEKYSYSKQLTDLTEIVSQFELAINSVSDPQVANYLVGFKMFLSQFDTLLSDFSISYIVPKEGDEYNSDTMEATSTIMIDEPSENNKITKVFKKGYRLHDRVIRLASVEVSKIKE